jgi:hypothetical protein
MVLCKVACWPSGSCSIFSSRLRTFRIAFFPFLVGFRPKISSVETSNAIAKWTALSPPSRSRRAGSQKSSVISNTGVPASARPAHRG